ncbi:hypothetical protein J3458_014320 [Metarhizium acridum]|uniref:uncharacterized protein n=1 Tax=Metarhizium acridum TaxID=92637 RepID=UPI001C6B56A1|nr:hypothetical protein J3458_014320 [Metarhizium acridum]
MEDLPRVCVHSPSFLQQYQRFWDDPSQAPLTWIALLYGIMSFAAQSQAGSLDQVQDPSLPLPFLEQIVQCLVLGNYSHGAPYAIEALLHYFVLERMRAGDTQAETWLLMGIILRLAQRMGYHRDPSHFPGITPFQGEMRRRVWSWSTA